jgi:hypothetical protein
MTKGWHRLAFLGLALVFIAGATYVIVEFAQGYRFDTKSKNFSPNGLLVTKSVPDSAQVWIDGKLKTATDNTISLSPGEYNVEIKKEGYTTWQKNLNIKKELVTTADAHIFSTFPGLRALTFTGAVNPVLSPDGQRVVFGVATSSATPKSLWVLDLSDRPLGLSRDPQQIIKNNPDGRDFSQGKFAWSPDSKQVLVTISEKAINGKKVERNFLVDADKITPESQLIDLGTELPGLMKQWTDDTSLRDQAQKDKLPAKLLEVIDNKVTDLTYSPDDTKIFYTATASATLPEGLVPPLPSTDDQPETRKIEPKKVYVYDLKEDKNFYVCEAAKSSKTAPESIAWFPTSRHLFIVQDSKLFVQEYDGTNKTAVYTGDFQNAFATPFPDGNRILIQTSIGKDSPLNLYAVSIR